MAVLALETAKVVVERGVGCAEFDTGRPAVRGEDSVENMSSFLRARSQASDHCLSLRGQALGEVPEGYRWSKRWRCAFGKSRARVQDRVIRRMTRRALGLGAHARWLFCDEPSAWSPQAGRRLIDSMLNGSWKSESVRLCCVGRLRHLRRKVQGVGGLNASRLAAARASTSNCCRRTKKSGGIGTNVCASIRLTS